jgi:hypothetical protein
LLADQLELVLVLAGACRGYHGAELALCLLLVRAEDEVAEGRALVASVNALGKLTERPLPVGVAPSVPRALTSDWAPALLASLPESLSDVVPPGVAAEARVLVVQAEREAERALPADLVGVARRVVVRADDLRRRDAARAGRLELELAEAVLLRGAAARDAGGRAGAAAVVATFVQSLVMVRARARRSCRGR